MKTVSKIEIVEANRAVAAEALRKFPSARGTMDGVIALVAELKKTITPELVALLSTLPPEDAEDFLVRLALGPELPLPERIEVVYFRELGIRRPKTGRSKRPKNGPGWGSL
jgi:hypothetical protein